MDDNVNREFHLGEVYYMRFDGEGSEQNGWRPGLVFQNNTGNRFSPNIIALPLTSSLKKAGQPTHVVVSKDDSGLKMDSMVLCENPERMSKDRIGDYLTTLPDKYMADVAAASILASSAIAYLDINALISLHKRATLLNKRRRLA